MKAKKLLIAALMMVAAASWTEHQLDRITACRPMSLRPQCLSSLSHLMPVVVQWAIVAWLPIPMFIPCTTIPPSMSILKDKFASGLGYSPWLSNLVPDMNLAYLALAYKINDRSSVAGTLRYFNCGEIEFRDQLTTISLGEYSPNEWAIDAAYSRMFGDYLSGAVAGRFIYSNLTQNQSDYGRAGISVAADVAVYYKRPVEWFSSMDADFAWGAAITNIR